MNNKVMKIRFKVLEKLSNVWILGLVIAATTLLLLDLSPIGGSMFFYAKWVQCGQKPVRIASAPGAGAVWYEYPPNFQLIRIMDSQDYYCTPSDAEAAGYKPASFYNQ